MHMEATTSPTTADAGSKLQAELGCRSGEHFAAVSQGAHFSKEDTR